ncbi:MAG: CNP1-like family protein [Burkholderiaceae bacterium]|jgi:hypothetical protein|nr:CNP1-like family protein [Burkholderiaceae bacterium]
MTVSIQMLDAYRVQPSPVSYAQRRHRARRRVTAFLTTAVIALVGANPAQAQFFEQGTWKESPIPPPPSPSFDASGLVEIDMPHYLSLRYAIDPATVKITGDGVVRYVIVALPKRNNGEGGARNAFYEGVHCVTGEIKRYARFMDEGEGRWEMEKAPEWKSIDTVYSNYAQRLVNQGLCDRGAAPGSADQLLRHLKNPAGFYQDPLSR